ncbi:MULTISPECIES: AAA family ATPase [unclassified Pseudomonas]|uniref:AAA family ATPase n=1 Tax=unclassified Pseudomonas TaxID=196821 RepID=UPI001A9E4C97|nr:MULTISPECIES: AAA family ATPase [unclassified Pseudomonas]
MLDLRVENAIKFWKSLNVSLENNNRDSIDILRLTLPLLSAKMISVRHNYAQSEELTYDRYAIAASKLDECHPESIYPALMEFLESLEEFFPDCNYKANLPDLIRPETLTKLKSEVAQLPYEFIRHTLDYGISIAIEFEGLAIRKHSALTADLAAPLTAGFDYISEVNPTAGDLFFRSAGSNFMSLESKSYDIIKTNTSPAFYLHLKYSTFDIKTTTQSLSGIFSPQKQFVLIDPPFAPLTGSSLIFSDQHPKSALETLIKITKKTSYDIAVTIVPRTDCTKPGITRDLRQRLIDGRKILAVVEFSSFNRAGKQILVTALVTSHKTHHHRNSILFIDATALRSLDKSENFSYMEFSAEIIKSWALELWPQGGAYHFENQPGRSSKIASNIFEREFGDGYKNIPGLCKEVEIDEIRNNDYKLAAKSHIGDLDKESKILSKINPAPVVEKLLEKTNNNKRIYVIGNNGEGKSLLLFDLVEELCKLKLRSVGIAFAMVDRFPLEKTPPYRYPAFIYAGAKNRSKSTSSSSSNLAKLIKGIFCNKEKLICFSSILSELGFSGNYYLIGPHKQTVVKGREPILLPLSSDPIDNADVFTYSSPRHTLGLMRETDDNQVTPFLELSSGEQQILSLIVKVLSYAQKDIIFLIDEPEISLHVSWQNSIPFILEKISTSFKCDFVVATHSPLLIASANYPQDFCFVAQKQKLELLPIESKKTVEGVLFDNFKTHTPNNRKIPERCAQLVSNAIEQANSRNPLNDVFSSAIAELDDIIKIIKLMEPAKSYSAHSQITLVASAKLAIQELSRLNELEV